MKTKYFVIFFIFLFFSCIVREKEVKNEKKYPDLVLDSYDHTIFKNNRIYLNAVMTKASFYEKQGLIECDNIKAEIYNSKNETITIITADKGLVNKDAKTVVFTGKVNIELKEKKMTMHSEELKLDYENNIMSSDKEVIIDKTDGSFLKTTKFLSDIKKHETSFETLDLKYFYDN